MSDEAAIDLRAVTRRFNQVAAVDGVDLRIESGEFFTILGPSGCGKSTTLRIVAGLEKLDRGSVLLHGEDVTSLPPERRDVSTVFQDYALFPHLTVVQNVLFPLKMMRVPRPEAERRALETLELVGLAALRDRQVTRMSGGERQRTALARSLVWQPGALLLDEPLAALDFRLRQEMQAMLKELQRTVGITFLFVTHDQTEAFRLSDRVAVMREGRLEQVGTPEELYYAPASLFVATFIGQINLLRGTVVSKSGQGVSVRCGDSTILGRSQHWDPTPGSKVLVGVRPEFVDWSVADATRPIRNGLNELRCRVEHVGFQGSVVETMVAIQGQPSWACLSLGRSADRGPKPGAAVALTWEPNQTWIFREDEGSDAGPVVGMLDEMENGKTAIEKRRSEPVRLPRL